MFRLFLLLWVQALLVIAAVLLFAVDGEAQPPAAVDPYRLVVVTRPSPYWGYLRHPLADIIDAQANYLVTRQKAIQEREASLQKKMQTRKKELEHIRWERKFTYEMREEERERAIKHELTRSRERAGLPEIIGGSVLNILLKDLSMESRSPGAPSEQLRQEWLDHVNFASTGGTAGLLGQKEISWPAVLQEDDFAASRTAVEEQLEAARKQAIRGKIPGAAIKELTALKDRLDADLTRMLQRRSSGWSPSHYIQARRFLANELNETLKLLVNGKEAAFLLGHKPTCKTVAELVQHMRQNALTFGPGAAGSERHYVSLHAAFSAEHRRLDAAKSQKN